MDKRINDGGPAFPQITELGDIAATSGGMTLRDWFAGQAMNGILAGYYGNNEMSGLGPVQFADDAYHIADAMLAARKGGAQ